MPGVLALAPVILLVGNNYGGEGSLRVFLFGSPWLATLIGWAITTLRPRRVSGVSVALAAALTTLFLFAFIGNAGTNVIPADEVTASDYFYAHAPHHSVLMLAGEDFPLQAGPNYRFMAGPGGDHSPNLLEQPMFRGRTFRAADVARVIHAIELYSRSGYIAFSTTQSRYAQYFGTTPKGAFAKLESLIAASPAFTRWYTSPNVRIYRLVGSCDERPGRYPGPGGAGAGARSPRHRRHRHLCAARPRPAVRALAAGQRLHELGRDRGREPPGSLQRARGARTGVSR